MQRIGFEGDKKIHSFNICKVFTHYLSRIETIFIKGREFVRSERTAIQTHGVELRL